MGVPQSPASMRAAGRSAVPVRPSARLRRPGPAGCCSTWATCSTTTPSGGVAAAVLARLGLHTNYRASSASGITISSTTSTAGRASSARRSRPFCSRRGLSPAQIDEVEAACQARRNQWELTARLLPGVKTTLGRLHAAGMVMGVLSDSEHPATVLVPSGSSGSAWADCFNAVVSSIDLERIKPDPVCYLTAARGHGTARRRVAFVGHDARELAGAQRRRACRRSPSTTIPTPRPTST